MVGTLFLRFFCRLVQDHLRTPAGRPVVLVNMDATDIKIDKTSDAFCQMQTYSADRGKGHCVLFSNLTCPAGTVLAVSPGPNISCPPRGGENVSIGVQLRMAEEREAQSNTCQGFTKLLKGTHNIGTAL